MIDGATGLFLGAAGLGLLHGIEPGHGWPVAAAWAIARRSKWRSGALAATVIGVGHLVSSIAVVLVFFGAKQYFALGGRAWIDPIAGVLLLLLAAWQLRAARHGGHHHHDEDAHGAAAMPRSGLWALVAFAFTLGFAHEEEFQIIALCTGSAHCLSLMLTYALAVIVALVVLTLALIAGMEQFRHRLEHAQRTLTYLSATILALMGLGFLAGVF